MEHNSEALAMLKNHMRYIADGDKLSMKVMRSDQGGVFTDSAFKLLLQ